MRGRMLLETSDQGLRNILDGQSCHGSLFCDGSVMAPLWRLADAYRRVKADQMHRTFKATGKFTRRSQSFLSRTLLARCHAVT
jgi:hypothetical protein